MRVKIKSMDQCRKHKRKSQYGRQEFRDRGTHHPQGSNSDSQSSSAGPENPAQLCIFILTGSGPVIAALAHFSIIPKVDSLRAKQAASSSDSEAVSHARPSLCGPRVIFPRHVQSLTIQGLSYKLWYCLPLPDHISHSLSSDH